MNFSLNPGPTYRSVDGGKRERSPVWSQCQWLHMTASIFLSSTPPSSRISLMFLGMLRPGTPYLIEAYVAGELFHQSFLDPRSNMMVLPSFLFLIRKAKVGMFMCSWPFWTGSTKDSVGTTISVVVLIMDTSTVEVNWGIWREGCAFGLISSSAMVN